MKYAQYRFCLFFFFFAQASFGQSVGGFVSGAASYCDSVNSGFLSLNSFNGLVLYWEESTDDQNSWQQIQNTTSTQSYNQLKKTTSYRAIVQDGSFPQDTSTVATITVHVPGIAGSVSGGGTFCSGANTGSFVLSGTSGNVIFWQSKQPSGVWVNITNTSYTLSFTNLTNSAEYRAVVQRVPGCDADTSSRTSVIIDAQSQGGIILGGDSLCHGAPGDTLFLTGSNGSEILWLSSTSEGENWVATQQGQLFYKFPRVETSTWYATVVKNGVCEPDTSAEVLVYAFPKVISEAGPDMMIRRKESVRLQGQGSNGTYLWSPADGLSDSANISPDASPRFTTNYHLKVTDVNGCSASDSMLVTVEIPIPTAFTPNGDGVNDNFEIYQVEKFPKCAINVYDRWGNLVYTASPYLNDWYGGSADGSDLADGTYYYTFDYGLGEKPASGYVLIKR